MRGSMTDDGLLYLEFQETFWILSSENLFCVFDLPHLGWQQR